MRWITALGLSVILIFAGCSKNEVKTEDNKAVEEQLDMEEDNSDSSQMQLEFSELEPEIENMGEGAPSTEALNLQDSDNYQIGDSISIILNNQVLYELKIDDVAYTEMRDVYAQEPGNVILVTYTYTNRSDEELLIDDMRFQMMLADENTLLDSYYLADVQVPEPVVNGQSCTAQIAYATEEKVDNIVLAYHDTTHMEIMPVKVTVDNLQ